MKNILSTVTLLISINLQAQYYYNDIIGTREINDRMKACVTAKVQSVTAAGYDAGGRKTTDFNEWQDVQSGGSVLKITSRNGQNVTRLYYQFDNNTRLINARDSSGDVQTITDYVYDRNGNLASIKTTTKGLINDFDQTKERQWQYTTENKPVKMLLIINGADSTEYIFSLDEHKNVKDEMMYHRGGSQNQIYYSYEEHKIYYFYDDQNRLTDVTRYNQKAKRLLPDYMFEYDENNHVIQRITALSNTRIPDYLIWRYGYDEKGLKTKEVLYGKAKELKGKIEYSYIFVP